jgi:uncharacterized membrane protein YoaK (UPF0700 family)
MDWVRGCVAKLWFACINARIFFIVLIPHWAPLFAVSAAWVFLFLCLICSIFLEYYLANEGCYRSFTLLHTTWYNLHGVSRTVIIVHLHPPKEDQRHVTMSGRKLGRQHHRLAVARMHVMCAAAAAQGSLPKQVRVTVVAGRKSMCCVMQAADFWKVTCLTHNTSIIYGVLKQLQLVKVMMKQVRWCM